MSKRNQDITNPMDRDFIRLLTDFGFKRVFGSKEHAGILMKFLNALFEGEMRITKVEFRDKELLPEHAAGKKVMYDIYCTADEDRHFIVEMQQEESENFADRILFYISKAIVNQGIKGVEYELDPVYCVVVTNFNLSHMSRSLVKDLMLTDRKTGEIYSSNMRILFLSLPEVPKEWDECDTELLRMLYLIKNMETLTRESKPYMSGHYADIFQASATGNLTPEEAVKYSESYFKELDNQSSLRFTAKKNREEGRAEGRVEEKLDIARKMKRKGMDSGFISSMTGLSESEIESL